MSLHIGIVGDIHGHWKPADNAWFDRRAYDLLVVVGDLAGFRFSSTLRVARQLARLQCPTLVLLGNHDASTPAQQVAEYFGKGPWADRRMPVQADHVRQLRETLTPHDLGGYSTHRVGDLTVIAGRPHSLGGPEVAFRAHLQQTWGVGDMPSSTQRLCHLVDSTDTDDLMFVSHNGPTGLGSQAGSIWGCDFKPEQGDWGDPDLEAAILHAKRAGKRVRVVAAGHMHRRHRGGVREYAVHADETVYVNAADVPRIRGHKRHHVEVVLDDAVHIHEHWIEETV